MHTCAAHHWCCVQVVAFGPGYAATTRLVVLAVSADPVLCVGWHQGGRLFTGGRDSVRGCWCWMFDTMRTRYHENKILA